MANALQVSAELERFVEQIMVKITLDLTANLIQTTPVDTGWARANWIPEIGLRDIEPAPQPASGGSAGAAGAQALAVSTVIAQYKFPEKIQVGNGVPYIGVLNDGHSAQAPSGFVQRAINKTLTSDLQGLAT